MQKIAVLLREMLRELFLREKVDIVFTPLFTPFLLLAVAVLARFSCVVACAVLLCAVNDK